MNHVWVIEQRSGKGNWYPSESVFLSRKEARKAIKEDNDFFFQDTPTRVRKYISYPEVIGVMAQIAQKYED